jgi:hypothetical protein
MRQHVELFMNQMNRNKRVKELKAQGVGVRKSSTGACLLHHQYIVDYQTETGTILTKQDKGFGNAIYKTGFKNLYSYDILDS